MKSIRTLVLSLCVVVNILNLGHCAVFTYPVEKYCGDEVSMITEDTYQIRVSLDGSRVPTSTDCKMSIEAWYRPRLPRLMFYFESLDIDCNDGHLEFYNGYESFRSRVDGLPHTVCGSNTAKDVYTTKYKSLYIKYVNKQASNASNSASIIVTAFDDAPCKNYDHACDNGRCIDSSTQCNGFNSCGDNSDCKLAVYAIVGIVLGSLGVLTLIISGIGTVVCCVRSNKRRKALARSQGQVLFANGQAQIVQPAFVQPPIAGAQYQPEKSTQPYPVAAPAYVANPPPYAP